MWKPLQGVGHIDKLRTKFPVAQTCGKLLNSLLFGEKKTVSSNKVAFGSLFFFLSIILVVMCKPVQSKSREALASFYLYLSLILINVLSRLLPRLVDDGETPAKKTKKDKKKKKKEDEVRQYDDDQMDTSAAVRMRPFHAILVQGKGSNGGYFT